MPAEGGESGAGLRWAAWVPFIPGVPSLTRCSGVQARHLFFARIYEVPSGIHTSMASSLLSLTHPPSLAFWLSFQHPRCALPQGLCTSCSLCLYLFSAGSLSHLIFSGRPSLTTLLKTVPLSLQAPAQLHSLSPLHWLAECMVYCFLSPLAGCHLPEG